MTSQDIKSILAANLRRLRLNRGLSQREVAGDLKIPAPTYSGYERGRTEPGLDFLTHAADYYNTSLDALLRPDRSLKIGSWIPLGTGARFHPINYQSGFYTIIYPLVFDRVFFFDVYRQRFYPEMVTSFNIDRTDSRCEYTFNIRRDVRFSDGTPLEVGDVQYSYELYLERNGFYRRFIDAVEVDEQENAIRLKLGKHLELRDLPAPYIVPRSSSNGQCYIGTGPYKMSMQGMQDGFEQPLVLQANDQHFGGVPSIPSVEFYKFENTDELGDALEKGRVNFAVNLAWENPTEFEVKYGFGGDIAYYLILKQNKLVCVDVDFRRCVDHALDRRSIAGVIEDLVGVKTNSLPLYHLHNLIRETPMQEGEYRYDPNEAVRYYQAAQDSLEDVTFCIASTSRGDAVESALANEVIEQLQKVGISAVREENNDPVKADAVIGVIRFDSPRATYEILHSKESEKTTSRFWGGWSYSNGYIDEILDSIASMSDYQKIQDVLSRERIFIPLFRGYRTVMHTKELDTRSGPQISSFLYAPELVCWRFKG